MSRPKRLRRVQLSTPGSSEKMMAKAAASLADHVFLDLEDSVAPSAKVEARHKIVEALNGLDWSRKTRCVRINDLSTKYAYEDIITVVEGAGRNLDTIMMTKVMRASEVAFVDTLLNQIEAKLGLQRRIGIEVLIEEVDGMMNVEEIARASDRLECLVFGMGDYSASQGVDVGAIGANGSYPGDIWHYCRYKILIAARSAKIDAVDGPFANFRDPEAYREECRRASILGCDGKWAIHPSQIDIALEVFTPDREAVASARKLAAAYAEAEAKGLGAVNVDGIMVDAASVRIVGNTLRKADLIGM